VTPAQLADASEREHGRLSALAGRPIFANPHIGVQADEWFMGYRTVPTAEIGSQPDLLAAFRGTRKKALAKTPRASAAGWRALRDRVATPRPWAEGAAL